MNFIKTKIKGCYIIKLEKFFDDRGYFTRAFCKKILKQKKIQNNIFQVNFSFSEKKGTLRGLHFQKYPFEEMKIIYCIKGEIFDTAVDLRKKSKTYKKYFSTKLTDKNRNGLIIPKGCAHGFQTLKDKTEVIYFTNQYYNKSKELGINYSDPTLKIKWPLKISELSSKDYQLPNLPK